MMQAHLLDRSHPKPTSPNLKPAVAGFFILLVSATPAFAQVCHDCVWEPTEFCGNDAACVTGVPEMNHDCINDFLDMAYFIREVGSVGPNFSGDFAFALVSPGFVDASDLAYLVDFFGDSVPGCTPALAQPDSCGGTLSLSFSADPNIIMADTTVVPIPPFPWPVTLYLVADGLNNAEVLEYSIEHTDNIQIFPNATPLVPISSTTTSTYYEIISDPTLFANGPVIVRSWVVQVLDANPITFELKPVTPVTESFSSSPTGIRWADSNLNRRVNFTTTNNAAINGTPPASGAPCSLTTDIQIASFTSPAGASQVIKGCDTLNVTYTLHNHGPDAAGSFSNSLRVSSDNTITVSDDLISSVTVGSLPAWGDTTISVTAVLPATFPRGDVFLGVIADELGQVVEDDETNNTRANAFSFQVPLISSITDIGNDQGRSVRIELQNSPRDAPGSPTPVLQYEAFRRIDALPKAGADRLGQARERGMISDPQILIAGWEFVGAIPAHEEAVYNMVAPTLADSSAANGVHWSVFFMRAATASPGTFFDSCPDSGFSRDNLPPNKPMGFGFVVSKLVSEEPAATISTDVQLSWEANEEQDLASYALYRDLDPDFVPQASNRIAQTTQTSHVDAGGAVALFTYKLSAVDVSGNESDYASTMLQTSGVPGEDEDLPRIFSARPGTRNPVREGAVLLFDLPVAASVSLHIYDVRGRLVRSAYSGESIAAGRHRWEWDLRDDRGIRVPQGLYMHRFQARDFSRIVKTVVLR